MSATPPAGRCRAFPLPQAPRAGVESVCLDLLVSVVPLFDVRPIFFELASAALVAAVEQKNAPTVVLGITLLARLAVAFFDRHTHQSHPRSARSAHASH